MGNIAIALDSGSPPQRNELTNYLARNGWSYWHWIDDFWIVQVPDSYTPESLHDELEALPRIDKATILVFEFSGRIKFWGRNKNEAWEWLNYLGEPS